MSHPDEEDDAALFRSAIGEVTPMRPVEAPAAGKPRPKPRARMAEQDESEALYEFVEDDNEIDYLFKIFSELLDGADVDIEK